MLERGWGLGPPSGGPACIPLGSRRTACGLVRLGRAPAAGMVRPAGRPAGRLRHAGQHPRGAAPAVPPLPTA
eukprot:183648-Alexandrium_andersonii.AAC.1